MGNLWIFGIETEIIIKQFTPNFKDTGMCSEDIAKKWSGDSCYY